MAEAEMTDIELLAALAKYDSKYSTQGGKPLTDAQRQIRVKSLHHYQAKEKKEAEAAEKKNKEVNKAALAKAAAEAKVAAAAAKAAEKAAAERAAAERAAAERTAAERAAAERASAERAAAERVAAERAAAERVVENGKPPAKRARGGRKSAAVTQSDYGNIAPSQTTLNIEPSRVQTTPAKVSLADADVLTTQVTDTQLGGPAVDLRVTLYGFDTRQEWKELAIRSTNATGECPGLITKFLFLAGLYRLRFDTGDYYRARGVSTFYPHVEIVFEVTDPGQHVHLPLMLGPYAYSIFKTS